MEYDNDIRSYLTILEYYSEGEPAPVVVEQIEIAPVVDYSSRLNDILFKLRNYSDQTGGEYSLGFEQGLEMAAAMIENLINAEQGDNSGS